MNAILANARRKFLNTLFVMPLLPIQMWPTLLQAKPRMEVYPTAWSSREITLQAQLDDVVDVLERCLNVQSVEENLLEEKLLFDSK